MSHDNQWAEKVARGRALVTEINDRKWELGDLANEVCPATSNGVHNDDTLGKFADEIGISRSTLKTYRYVASRWEAVARATAQTWTTHRMLAERDDRHEVIAEQVWTYNSLSERLNRLPNPSRRITPAHQAGIDAADYEQTPEFKREQFRALASDPDVIGDAGTRHHASAAISKASTESAFAGKAARAEEQGEADKKSRGDLRATAADGLLVSARRAIKDAASEIHESDLSDEARVLLRERIAELREHLNLVEREVEGIGTDWDAEMAALMGGDR